MYATFSFYSLAQLYALTLDIPVAIMLGEDNLYWVVQHGRELQYLKKGWSLLSGPLQTEHPTKGHFAF